MVDTFQNFLNGHGPKAGLREQDLWDEIFYLLSDAPEGISSIQWMPSHCSEPGNEAKLAKYISLGILCDDDVTGNDGADELAKSGANLHTSIDYLFNAAVDRKRVSTAVQKMYLSIWDMHTASSDTATQSADDADIAEV